MLAVFLIAPHYQGLVSINPHKGGIRCQEPRQPRMASGQPPPGPRRDEGNKINSFSRSSIAFSSVWHGNKLQFSKEWTKFFYLFGLDCVWSGDLLLALKSFFCFCFNSTNMNLKGAENVLDLNTIWYGNIFGQFVDISGMECVLKPRHEWGNALTTDNGHTRALQSNTRK